MPFSIDTVTKTKSFSFPEPFRSASILPFDDHGWLTYPNELRTEVKKVVDAGGKIFVELGSWIGKSARIIAPQLPYDAKLYCIDTWNGTLDEPEQLKLFHDRIVNLFQIFLSNCIQKRVAHKIHPIRMTSHGASKIFKEKIDFLFIDNAHTYDFVYKDIMHWYPRMSEIGVMTGDDYFIGTTAKAVDDAAKILNFSIVHLTQPKRFWKYVRNNN
jgi:hypothetical protein